jgi:hypothetical protein
MPKSKELRVSNLRLSLFDSKDEDTSMCGVPNSTPTNNNEKNKDNAELSTRSCMSVSSNGDNVENPDPPVVKSSQKRRRSVRRSVSFGDVSCRLYNRTVGLHPAVSSGAALDFSWDYFTTREIPIDDYESIHNDERRRTRTELIIPKFDRHKMLMSECGIPRTTIASFVRSINQAKSQRRQTLNNLKFAPFEEKWQRLSRGVKRALLIRKTYDEEAKMLWTKAAKAENDMLNKSNSSNRSNKLDRSESTMWSGTTNSSNSSNDSMLCAFLSPIICCQRKAHSDLEKTRHRIHYDIVNTKSSNENMQRENSTSNYDIVSKEELGSRRSRRSGGYRPRSPFHPGKSELDEVRPRGHYDLTKKSSSTMQTHNPSKPSGLDISDTTKITIQSVVSTEVEENEDTESPHYEETDTYTTLSKLSLDQRHYGKKYDIGNPQDHGVSELDQARHCVKYDIGIPKEETSVDSTSTIASSQNEQGHHISGPKLTSTEE